MNSLLSFNELIDAVHGKVVLSDFYKSTFGDFCNFTNVQTDSRNVCEKSLFVPLVGEFQDGHKYVAGAVESGASVVLINNSEYEKNPSVYDDLCRNKGVLIICVENTLHGLQDAAEKYVSKFPNLTKISVTGSSGKTTTKELLVSVFVSKFGDDVVYTKGNFNSETGLPLSVFNIRENHKFGIFEMGMNRENEIGEISKVLKSDYGIITNIGTAHIGLLGSRENIAKEKRKSFDYICKKSSGCGAAFVCAEDDFADFCVENVIANGAKVIKYGESVSGEVSGIKFLDSKGLKGTLFAVDGVEVLLPLSGKYNFLNAMGVVACAKELGFSAEEIKIGLESFKNVAGRMEILEAKNESGVAFNLIKDCYNANPDSMNGVLDFCDSLENVGKKIFVLADMKELGEKSIEAHSQIGKILCKMNPDLCFLVGSEMQVAYDYVCNSSSKIEKSVIWYKEKGSDSFSEIAKQVNDFVSENDVVLLKGSNSMELEKIVPMICKTCVKNDKKGGC